MQSRYLHALVDKSGFRLDQIVTGSQMLAAFNGRPDMAFGLTTFTAWLNGIHNPTNAHRYALAKLFGLSSGELNDGIDGPFDWDEARSILQSVIAVVSGRRRHFVYHLAILNKETDLSRPAIYPHWADMFVRAAALSRHFKHLKYRLYGWIPETTIGPINRYSSTLVALASTPASAQNTQRYQFNLCFVRLMGTDRSVQVGVREGRWLLLPGPAQPKIAFDSTEIVGCVTGEPLLTLHRFSVERLEALAAFHEQPSFGV